MAVLRIGDDDPPVPQRPFPARMDGTRLAAATATTMTTITTRRNRRPAAHIDGRHDDDSETTTRGAL
jgi:hypothetical protein